MLGQGQGLYEHEKSRDTQWGGVQIGLFQMVARENAGRVEKRLLLASPVRITRIIRTYVAREGALSFDKTSDLPADVSFKFLLTPGTW